MSRIKEQDVQNAVDTLNSMLPRHEVKFGHRYNYYALDYRQKGTTVVKGLGGTIITCATKRECYDIAWAMIKAIELSQMQEVYMNIGGNNAINS